MGGEAGLIRAARTEDAAAMARVHVESWRSTYAGLVPDSYLESLSREKSEADWRARLAGNRGEILYFIAGSSAGEVVGFACGGARRGEESHPEFEAELYALYLLAEHQRQGYGGRLLAAMAGELRQAGVSSLMAWVLAENPSRRFYEALGGRPLGSREIEIGGARLEEVAYGWDDLQNLVSPPARRA